MVDATLRLLDAIRGAASPDRAQAEPAIAAFMCLLYGTAPESLDDEQRARIAEVLARADTSGSIVLDEDRARPFRIAYRAVVSGDEPARAPAAGGALALEGLFTLERDQRAALALSCVLGFRDREIGSVLGVSAERARTIVDIAVDAIRDAAGARAARTRDGETRTRDGAAA